MIINHRNQILAKQVLNEINKYDLLAKSKNKGCLNISWLKSTVGLTTPQWAEIKAGSQEIKYETFQHVIGVIKQARYNLITTQPNRPSHKKANFKQQQQQKLTHFLKQHPKQTNSKQNTKMQQFIQNHHIQIKTPQQHTHHIITSIHAQKNNSHRFNVFVDGRFCFPVSADVWAKFRLYDGMYITSSLKHKIVHFDNISKLTDVAVKYVARNLRTAYEVKNKLTKNQGLPNDIDTVIRKLKHYHLIDDKHYAAAYVRTQVRKKNKGPIQIRHHLRVKGIQNDLIQFAINKFYPKQTAFQNGLKQAKKDFKRYQRNPFRKAIQKTKANLMRKGYSSDLIAQILQEADFHPDRQAQKIELERRAKIAFKRYQRFEPYKRKLKIKQYLYRRGFSFTSIDKAFDYLNRSN